MIYTQIQLRYGQTDKMNLGYEQQYNWVHDYI